MLLVEQLTGGGQLRQQTESGVCPRREACTKCLGADLGEGVWGRLHGGGGTSAGLNYFSKSIGGNRLCKGTELQRYTRGKAVEGVLLGRTLVLQA